MCVGRDSQQMFGQSPARLSEPPLTESVALHGESSKLLRQPGNVRLVEVAVEVRQQVESEKKFHLSLSEILWNV